MEKAYIIMAHKNPRQVHRLVSRLNDGFSEFFIHIDKTVAIAPFENIKEIGKVVQFIERVDSKWGGFGSVQASLNGLKAIKNSGKSFDHIFLLSGQDYPIKTNAAIDQFLAKSPYSVFIEYFPIPNYKKWSGKNRGGLYRVDKYYFGLKKQEILLSKTMNFLAGYLHFLQRKIPNVLKPYAGSQWWSMDMKMLNYILDYDNNHPEYRAFHKYTFVPDELYLQMIVANISNKTLIQTIENNNKRFMIWEKASSAHPNILRAKDFGAIIASDQLFARKFDENVDAEILNLIDQEILFKTKMPATEITNKSIV